MGGALATLQRTGSVGPAASVIIPAQLSAVQLPRDVIARRTPSAISTAPIRTCSVIAVAVRHTAPPPGGMETGAAAARHLDDVRVMLIGRGQNWRGIRRHRGSGEAESTNKNRSCHTHLDFLY